MTIDEYTLKICRECGMLKSVCLFQTEASANGQLKAVVDRTEIAIIAEYTIADLKKEKNRYGS